MKNKHLPIHVPSEWYTVTRITRKNPSPLVVTTLRYDDFMDFKSAATPLFKGTQKDNEGNKVQWLKIRWLMYKLNDANEPQLQFKYDLDEDSPFRTVKLKKTAINVKGAYTADLPISTPKQKDLLCMCSDRTTPRKYHAFYNNLKATNSVRDALAEPALSDGED